MIVADSYSGVRRPCVAYLTHFNFLVEEAERGSSLMEAVQAEGEAPALPGQGAAHGLKTLSFLLPPLRRRVPPSIEVGPV